jgi:hypothetical protein
MAKAEICQTDSIDKAAKKSEVVKTKIVKPVGYALDNLSINKLLLYSAMGFLLKVVHDKKGEENNGVRENRS